MLPQTVRWIPRDPNNPGSGDVWMVEPFLIRIPMGGSFVIGSGKDDPRAGGESPFALYFAGDGTPLGDRTLNRLHKAANDYLSVLLGRRLPDTTATPPVGEDAEIWEAWLRAYGLGPVCANDPTVREEELEGLQYEREKRRRGEPAARRDVGASAQRIRVLPPAHWYRWVLARVGMIFDRPVKDPLVIQCAKIVAGERWWEWPGEPKLRELLEQIDRDRRLWTLMLILESFARRRAEFRRDMVPGPITFKWSRGVKFSFPRWPSKGPGSVFTSARQKALLSVGAATFRQKGKTALDEKPMAAAVWLARDYVKCPPELVSQRITLASVAKHFGLTRRQVEYAAKALRKEVDQYQRERLDPLPSQAR